MLRCGLLLVLLCAGVAAAQVPPPPAERFKHPDPAARVYFPRLDEAAGLDKLFRHIEKRPGDSRGWTARAYWHAVNGREAEALADLERARGVIDGSQRRMRETLWSEGWIRLLLGHVPEASAAWTEAVGLHGGRPYWVPYSFALLAELGGERQIALAWYQRAVWDYPERWGTRHGVLRHTRHWRDPERLPMLALYEAWLAGKQGKAQSGEAIAAAAGSTTSGQH